MLAQKLIILCLFMQTMVYAQVDIQQSTYLYATPSIKSKRLKACKFMYEIAILEKSQSATIKGVTDFWYKARYNETIGYVFGDYTTLRKKGQRVVRMTFKGCDQYDEYRYFFDDYDFALAPNVPNLFKELCTETDNGVSGKKQYINKQFTLLVNDLWGYDPDRPGGQFIPKKRMTIIAILKKGD